MIWGVMIGTVGIAVVGAGLMVVALLRGGPVLTGRNRVMLMVGICLMVVAAFLPFLVLLFI